MESLKKNKTALIASGVAVASLSYLFYKLKKSKPSSPNSIHPCNPHLDQISAERRSTQIQSSVTYNLYLNLKKGTTYSGKVKIYFKSKCTEDIFLDFEASKVNSITINGVKILDISKVFNGFFIDIHKDTLTSTSNNIVEIEFENSYRNDGSGLHSYTDTDGKQYLYSQGEPYHIHKMFPCFDQPDIKGSLSLEATSPEDWVVISNEPTKNVTSSLGEKAWAFEKTPKLSTYLFAVIAGPYEEIKGENTYKGIPMSMYCRQSKMEDLRKVVDIYFEATCKSMEWYEKFFDYPFPFSKYDQIFCPEFNVGAMEHPGAVTFNDQAYIFKDGKCLKDQLYRACGTFAHELAHMWFGNLVTMKWWNDLWLNESFADFIAYYCLAEIEFSVKGSSFSKLFHVRKQWGYSTDQMTSTHPIAGEVVNTEAALSIFDGITYSKGASTLLQLLHLVSPAKFSAAISRYFKKYEWSNTVLADFIQEMELEFRTCEYPFHFSGEWRVDWIETAGMNIIEPEFDYTKQDYVKLVINQGYCLKEYQKLRFHKIKAAFFDSECQITEFDVLVRNQARTEVEIYIGNKKFDGLYLNYGDQTFAKVILDSKSVEFFQKNISKLDDKLTKCMIWRVLYEMVKDAKVPSTEYIESCVIALEQETDSSVVNDFLGNAILCISLFTPKVNKEELADRLFFTLLNQFKLLEGEVGSEKFELISTYLLTLGVSEKALSVLIEWMHGSQLSFAPLNINNKWSIARRVFSNNEISKAEKEQILNFVSGQDDSDEKEMNVTELKARISTGKARDEIWDLLKDPECKESLFMQMSFLKGFNHGDDPSYKYYKEFFTALPTLLKVKSQDFVKKFVAFGFPSTDNVEVMRDLILRCAALIPKLEKNAIFGRTCLISNKESLERRLRAFVCFEESKKK